MKKISKHMEISCQSLGAAMFMAAVCVYMAAGIIIGWASEEGFRYHIPFVFLLQGVVLSMTASIVWTLFFGLIKSWKLPAKYFSAMAVVAALLGISMLIPAINSKPGHFIWIISCFISTIGFGTLLAVFSEAYLKKTGERSVLVWEIQ